MEFKQALETIGEVGVVTEINHTIITVAGLPGAQMHEIVIFEAGAFGEVFELDDESLSILILEKKPILVGSRVARTNTFLSVPVGSELLGHVINPLGNTLEQSRTFKMPTTRHELEVGPPTMSDRARITTPFLTGTAVVDMMVPLGKGQRELILGDRKTGKSSFVLSTVKNQVNAGAIAIYAAIGKEKSDIKEIEKFFRDNNILDKVIIVATSSYDPAGFIYLTPYSAMTIAEYFRDQGQNVVVVFDDLSTHARFYREVSLIARKFPGRESYPGDIFAIHAKLLERAGNFKNKAQNTDRAEVSITALPLVELVQGDLTGYVPTNLMSITDGHIYFDSNVYYQGRRPAVNIALSVTRVGRQAQSSVLRRINRELTAFISLYEKMLNLSHFGAELTETVQHLIKTGDMIYTFFTQPVGFVIPLNAQIVFFGMLWLKMFDDNRPDLLTKSRNLFCAAYEQDQNVRKMVDKMVEVKTFNDLLGQINKNRDTLLQICKTS